MATCTRCGAEILWKRLDGLPFAVDAHETTMGVSRYAEHGTLLLQVADTSEVSAYVDHRTTCPRLSR